MTPLTAPLSHQTRFDRESALIAAAAVLLLVGYVLPWLGFERAGFALNGFDLAEWLSLHPAARAESPALLSAGAVRLTLLWAACAVAFVRLPVVLRALWIVVLAIAALPPLEHILTLEDANYAQQSIIAFVSASLPLALLFLTRRARSVALLALALCVGFAAIFAAARTIELMVSFQVDIVSVVGMNTGLVAAVMLFFAGVMALRQK
jgi:hypothetical protein